MRTTTVTILYILLGGCQTQTVLDLNSMESTIENTGVPTALYASPEQYLHMVEEQPENPQNWLLLGNYYAQSNHMDAAIIAYREALAHDNRFTKAWYNLGIARLRQAADSFNEIRLYADPDDPAFIQGREVLEGILELIQAQTRAAEPGTVPLDQ